MEEKPSNRPPTLSSLVTQRVLRAALDQLDEAVILTDPDGSSPGPHVVYANAAFSRITGYVANEYFGMSLRSLVGSQTDASALAALEAAFRNGEPIETEVVAHKKGGAEMLLGMHLAPVLEGTRRTHFMGILRDRTEQRRMEAIAAAANLAKDATLIFAGIRHEIGNPVNSVKAALSLVEQNLSVFPAEKTHSYMRRALAEIGRIEFLLKAMRSFSSFEKLDVVDVAVPSFLKEFVGVARQDLERRSIRLSTFIDAHAGRMRADPRALYQVLLNLVSNAVDAVEDMPAPRIEISAFPLGGRLVICVADNGVGLSPEHLPRVFDPFFTTKRSGTGLGLPIVRRLCASMHATIRIEGEQGRGAAAIVELERSDS